MPANEKNELPNSQIVELKQINDQSLSKKLGDWLKRHYLTLINFALATF